MNRRHFLVVVVLVIAVFVLVAAVAADGKSDLARVKQATSKYHRPDLAQAEGWDLREGLDHCFNNQPSGGMGYHYINTDVLDATVDVLEPEAMVYAPLPNGKLQLAAVEYIVDKESWDSENPGVLPEALGQEFHAHSSLPVYILHAWIWRNNPSGLFEDWNPTVSCF